MTFTSRHIIRSGITLVLLLFISITSAYSQEGNKFELYAGGNFGINASRITTSSVLAQSLDLTAGQSFVMSNQQYGLGLLLYSEFNKGIRIEFNSVQVGWTETSATSAYKNELTYLDIPLLSQIEIGKKATKISLLFGPKISFVTKQNRTFTGDIIPRQQYYFADIDSNVDFGAVIGGGITYKRPFGLINLQFRLAQSITNIYLPENTPDKDASRNQSVAVTVSIMEGLSSWNKSIPDDN